MSLVGPLSIQGSKTPDYSVGDDMETVTLEAGPDGQAQWQLRAESRFDRLRGLRRSHRDGSIAAPLTRHKNGA